MKVLQINCVYRKGSTGKIVYDLHTFYKKNGIESYVVYGRGEKPSEENVYKVSGEIGSKLRNAISRFTGNLYGMGKCGLWKTIRLLKKISPDIVHMHCINGFFIDIYGLLKYLKEKNIPTLLTLHAEFMYTGNCGYAFDCDAWKTGCTQCPNVWEAISSKKASAPKKNWKKMAEAFAGFNNLYVAGVSDWVSNRAKISSILKDKKITTVLNGLDDSVFQKVVEPIEEIERIHQKGKKVILFVTPYFESENKGGKWVLELSEKLKNEPIEFIVIGRTEKSYSYGNIQFIGPISSPNQLASWYSQADVSLLVSKRETFSMVCAESLCCGTPIVGFEAGAPELIALKEYSKFVPYGDIDALAEQLMIWSQKELDKDMISRLARKTYSKQVMAENYWQAYRQLLKKQGEYGEN